MDKIENHCVVCKTCLPLNRYKESCDNCFNKVKAEYYAMVKEIRFNRILRKKGLVFGRDLVD